MARILAAALMLSLVLAGCGAQPSAPTAISQAATPVGMSTPVASAPETTSVPTVAKETDERVDDASAVPDHAVPDSVLTRAKQDLAARLHVPVQDIKLVAEEQTRWPSTALGCPSPDKMYAQVVTPGYLLMLEANGKQYEYHTDNGKTVVLCEGNEPATPVPPS